MFKLNEKRRLLKNFMCVNLSILLLFSAINSSAIIQPILNEDGNLGLTAQMIVYGTQMFTSLVFPQIVCDLIGSKFALLLSQIFQFAFIAMQAIPSLATLTPSKFLKNWFLSDTYLYISFKSCGSGRNRKLHRLNHIGHLFDHF